MEMKRDGRVAVITGGASGIGRRTAERLLAEQWTVWILDLVEDARNVGSQEAVPEGCRYLRCDVSEVASVQAAFAQVRLATASIDALVCSAGVVRTGPVIEQKPQEMDLMFDVNVKGALLCVQAALESLRLNASVEHPARVVFVGSVTGLLPKSGSGFYAATKAALHGLAKVLAVELGPTGITVNAVAPGTVATPMYLKVVAEAGEHGYRGYGASPLGRIAQPDDVASAILFLIGGSANYLNGVILPVDGGSGAAIFR